MERYRGDGLVVKSLNRLWFVNVILKCVISVIVNVTMLREISYFVMQHVFAVGGVFFSIYIYSLLPCW